MSLYHETASIVTGPSTHGGSLKSRIYGNKDLKSPPAQVYALAFEASKWSAVLKEVVENAQLLQSERKLTPALSILLVHDLLLAKKGIALPASHGLRAAVERHKARLQSEFTRARIRRKCPTLEALKAMVDAQLGPVHPRWIRVNALKSTIDEQLDTTFKGFEMVPSVEEVIASASTGKRVFCLDGHVPNLIAASPGIDFTKTEAYKEGKIILQDKASCFPAYLLDPRPEDGDIIDACSAPGNKTTHLAGILYERGGFADGQRILAFEKDEQRAKTLANMLKAAGSDAVTVVHAGRDFLKTDPHAPEFRRVGALLLDPSCSGSGISQQQQQRPAPNRKRKRHETTTTAADTTTTTKEEEEETPPTLASPSPSPSSSSSLSPDPALETRLASLAAFQLSIVLHALSFPAARKVTYSTCSVHAAENEQVVRAALASPVARSRGWRLLRRAEQVIEWDSMADEEESESVELRFGEDDDDEDGPFERDAEGRIVRGVDGMPRLKRARVSRDGDEEQEEEEDNEWGGFDD
ncbi:10ab74ae-b1ed-4650-90ca-fbe72ac0931e [Thermothielavioides terrestris]|uniref:10ab74ae-b1ed-4650-90ca-fbe72ac0931e n=1 Tax=Thermothielavioides terrestris TaxID=2587410 RepID=A0A446BJ73_9PEZI|nr:10ab74ae-b1ed-4650-90ca-fbe72ac0931e [Thermothielavioides terrestris]